MAVFETLQYLHVIFITLTKFERANISKFFSLIIQTHSLKYKNILQIKSYLSLFLPLFRLLNVTG